MAEGLERRKAIRGANRGTLTKYINEAKELLNESSTTESKDRLKTLKGLIENKSKIISDYDKEILGICAIEDIEREVSESDEIVNRAVQIQRDIDSFLSVTVAGPVLNNPESSANIYQSNLLAASSSYTGEGNHVVIQNGATNLGVKAKLPKLILPTFKGEVTKYRTFMDSFESAVDQNSSLNKVDKFNYLKALLEGPAARVIQGLALTEGNYDTAKDLLKQRYGKPQQIISAHMDELLKLKACSNESSSQLRYVYDQISVHVRELENLGVKSDQYGSLLIPVIMSKLSPEIRLQIARKTSTSVWEINELLEIIRNEVDARESSDAVKVKTQDSKQPYNNANNTNRTDSTASALIANGSNKQNGSVQCAFCVGYHFSASCEEVKDVESRKEILSRDKRCFLCLRRGHRAFECKSGKTCRKCGKRHHQSICGAVFSSRRNNSQVSNEQNKSTLMSVPPVQGDVITTTTNTRSRARILLQTATTIAYNESWSKSVPVRVLFDTGSQRSYITNTLKDKLGLNPVKRETLNLNTFGSREYTKQGCDLVKFSLQTKDHQKIDVCALSFPILCTPLTTKINLENYSYLQNLNLADTSITEAEIPQIDVLIGSDHYYDIVNGEIIRGEQGPVAIGSKLGWLLSGPTNKGEIKENFCQANLIIESPTSGICNSVDSNQELICELKRFWDTESIGISNNEIDNEEFLPNVTFLQDDRRYEVNLPWKPGCFPDNSNYQLCVNRLYQLRSKLQSNKELEGQYDNIFQEQIESGIIERVPVDETDNENSHFLPHHGVVRHDKETTRLRIVFDGSSKSTKAQHSINDCLEKGPNPIPLLFNILIKFRMHSIVIVADIEKAFHQIQISEEDRDMLRFLWFDDLANDNPEIIQFRFRRLVFGLTPSPAILNTVLDHHLNKYQNKNSELIKLLRDSLYVDDLCTGADSVEEAIKIYTGASAVMKEGGFNLRKWDSNSAELCEKINSTIENKPTKVEKTPGSKNDNSPKKVLGISWNANSDTLSYEFEMLVEYAQSLPATKRSVLRLSAKIFDPLGLLSPFTIKMKILFQALCVNKGDWDEKLEGEYLSSWNQFLQDILALRTLHVPRCCFENNPVEFQLHGFCDASEKAYAAAVFLRTCYDNGKVKVTLVAAKTRVSPLKRQSIPRLELLGATILARLIHTLSPICNSALKKDPGIFLWTDSYTTLCWIKNNRTWKQYIKHRIQAIHELTVQEWWRFCPGEYNPADIPSRGLNGENILSSKSWWTGPEFLTQTEDKWPKSLDTCVDNSECAKEIVKNPLDITHILTNKSHYFHLHSNLDKIIDIERFSTIGKLLRVTAYVLRFIKRIRKCRLEQHVEIQPSEMREAEIMWIRNAQEKHFPEEIYLLNEGSKRRTVYMNQFGLFLNKDTVICCSGRVGNSTLPEHSKRPILIPKIHPLTRLIIDNAHHLVLHNGVRETLCLIREKYWIPQGREAVKKRIYSCVKCKRVDGKSFQGPPMPPLPPARVDDSPPFCNTGVDYAGPLYVKPTKSSKEKTKIKAYICLFTCASTRAIHLELVGDLAAQSFLLAFRRFTSRRGLPIKMLSDNATTFKAAAKEISRIKRAPEVIQYLNSKRISWEFIAERAPWWGGFWERMVRSIKSCLKKTIGRATLTFEELFTLCAEIEATINNRPITYVYDDVQGISYPLTPSDLINGRRISVTPSDCHFEISSTHESLTKRLQHHKKILEYFTNCWKNEYLLGLLEFSKKSRLRDNQIIHKGDIVIMKGESSPRLFWKLAKVIELLPGEDGNVRAVKVQVLRKNGRGCRSFVRPVQGLIPLEVSQTS